MARIIRSADARRMPWRNGGGETIEIAAHPPGAGLDAFGWRVSLARIDRDGPFSAFPGVDRIFTVLDGDGVDLRVGARPAVRLTRDAPPWAFPGEAPSLCRLLGGPVTALNVMAARPAFACDVSRFDAGRGLPPADDVVMVVVCGEGAIATAFGIIERHDAIVVPAGASLQAEPRGPRATGVLVALRLRAEGGEP